MEFRSSFLQAAICLLKLKEGEVEWHLKNFMKEKKGVIGQLLFHCRILVLRRFLCLAFLYLRPCE